MRKGKIIIAMLVAFAIPLVSSSTCIVVINTKKEIFIGADSKRTIDGINRETGKPEVTIDSMYCKISHVEKMYITIAGFSDESASKAATIACYNAKVFSEIPRYFEEKLKCYLTAEIEYVKHLNKSKYNSLITYKEIGSASFSWIDKGSARLISIYYKITSKPEDPISIEFETIMDPYISFHGTRDHISFLPDRIIDSMIINTGYAATIKNLIQLEMKHRPNSIGGPIDILKMDYQGEKWIAKKKTCH